MIMKNTDKMDNTKPEIKHCEVLTICMFLEMYLQYLGANQLTAILW